VATATFDFLPLTPPSTDNFNQFLTAILEMAGFVLLFART
jgi:hypothetical protein